MKKKILVFLLIAAVLCSVLIGCGEDTNPTGTTSSDVTQNTTELTDPIITTETEPTFPDVDTLTLPEYNSMSAEQQQAVMDTFETLDEYFEWYNEKVQNHKDFVDQQLNPTESTENDETTETTTPNVSVPTVDEITYLDYNSMSADEQLAFINSFDSKTDFVSWYNTAKQEYYDSMIEIDGSTPIDLGEIIGTTDGSN